MNFKWLVRSAVATMVALFALSTELQYMIVPTRAHFPTGVTAIGLLVVGGLAGFGTVLSSQRLSHKTRDVTSIVAVVLVALGSALALLSLLLPHL